MDSNYDVDFFLCKNSVFPNNFEEINKQNWAK